MRYHVLPALLGLVGLVLLAVGVGLWVHYAAGLVVAGVGLIGAAWLLVPAPASGGESP